MSFYTGKNVFLTGGAGFIGSHAAEMLVEQGARVCVPYRDSTQNDYLGDVQDKIRFVRADLTDRENTLSWMRICKTDVVLNLAASKGGGIAHSMGHHASLFRDNLSSFMNVLECSRVAGVERFLVVSSACVYAQSARAPAPEEDGFKDEPESANAGYGWSKRMEEYLGAAYAKEFGMKIAIARPFNAYGPRDDFFAPTNHVIPGLIKRILADENPLVVWGSGTQTRSFLYATDFARGLLEVCEKYPYADVLNLGSDEEISIGDLAKLLAELLGKNIEIQFDTSKPDGQMRRACDTRKAAEKIGFRAQIPLRQGLQRTIEWYIAEKTKRNA